MGMGVYGGWGVVAGVLLMKGQFGWGVAHSPKYIPTPEAAELIRAYFVYNNFQDFNTWQQIARTRTDFDYSETPRSTFLCRVALKWEDRPLPLLQETAEARSKRTAKKRALSKLVEGLICQGLIAFGFREENFVERLPRRRRNESDSSSEGEDEKYPARQQLLHWLRNNQMAEVWPLLAAEEQRWKHAQAVECWLHGLRMRSLPLLQRVLAELQQVGETTQVGSWAADAPPLRQFFCGKQVKDPFAEDLTDFIRFYQLQKQEQPPTVPEQPPPSRRPSPELLPSERVCEAARPLFPLRQHLIQFFRPIEGRSLLHTPAPCGPTSFLGALENAEVPKFQRQLRELGVRTIHELYTGLLHFAHDYAFCSQVLKMMQQALAGVCLGFDPAVRQRYRLQGERYYLRGENLLAGEFLWLLAGRVGGEGAGVEGMVLPQRTEEYTFVFNCREPEEVLARKFNRKANTNEFEEMVEISVGEYVLMRPKLEGEVMVGLVTEVQPAVKVSLPALGEELSDPQPYTMVKLYNNKLYEKTASAIAQAAKGCMQLFDRETVLLWQPPSYPQMSVIAELLIEWATLRCSVLLLTLYPQLVHAQLVAMGFKAVKLGVKVEEKALVRSSVVVAHPAHVCCDMLKNYAFERVLVEGAAHVSEVMLLPAVIKGCRKLYLLGDPHLPCSPVSSPYCEERGMAVSLLARLFEQGKPTYSFRSLQENSLLFGNVMGWANRMIYGGQLLLFDPQCQTPLIKGFPWPSQTHRICLLHVDPSPTPAEGYNLQAFLCSFICAQVIKTGYTTVHEIACSTTLLPSLQYLQFHMGKMLGQLGETVGVDRLIRRLAHVSSGSIFLRGELSVVMVGGGGGGGVRGVVGAMGEGRRGVVVVGDVGALGRAGEWRGLVGWCAQNGLICRADLNEC